MKPGVSGAKRPCRASSRQSPSRKSSQDDFVFSSLESDNVDNVLGIFGRSFGLDGSEEKLETHNFRIVPLVVPEGENSFQSTAGACSLVQSNRDLTNEISPDNRIAHQTSSNSVPRDIFGKCTGTRFA